MAASNANEQAREEFGASRMTQRHADEEPNLPFEGHQRLLTLPPNFRPHPGDTEFATIYIEAAGLCNGDLLLRADSVPPGQIQA